MTKRDMNNGKLKDKNVADLKKEIITVPRIIIAKVSITNPKDQ